MPNIGTAVGRYCWMGVVALSMSCGGGCGPVPVEPDGPIEGGLGEEPTSEPEDEPEAESRQGDGGPPPDIEVTPATPLVDLDLSTGAGLCELYYRGGRNYVASLQGQQAPFRCNADAPLAEVTPEPFVLCEDNPEGIDFEKLAADGRIVFNMNAMVVCNATVQSTLGAATTLREQAAAYDGVNETLASETCEALITGLQQAGEACQLGWECADGLECEVNFITGTTQCLPPAELGATCGSNARGCGEGLVCLNDVCTARVGVGQSCAESSAQCDNELRCSVDAICVQPVGEGEACSLNTPCGPLLNCRDDVCVTPPPLVADDAPCDESDQCETLCFKCRNDGTGTMRCLNHGATGEFCEAESDCTIGFSCVNGTCREAADAGESCDDIACDSKSYCDGPSQVCVEKRYLGGTCAADRECTSAHCADGECRSGNEGALCEYQSDCIELDCRRDDDADAFGVCAPYPAFGPCAPGRKCAESAFCNDAEVCQALKAVDESCEAAAECASSACVQGHCTVAAGSCLGTDASAPGLVGFYGVGWLFLRRRRRCKMRPSARGPAR